MLVSVPVHAEEAPPSVNEATIDFRPSSPEERLKGLEFQDGKPAMRPGSKTGDNRPFVKLKGSFKRSGSILIIGTERAETDDDGDFAVEIPIESKMTYLTVTAVDLRGGQESAEYILEFPDWDLFNANTRIREGRKNIVTFGAGPTFVTYTETLSPDVTQFGVSGWAGYRRLILPPLLDFRASLTALAIPIFATGGLRYWTVGLNLLAGVVLPYPKEPWRVGVLVGYYRVHMFQPDNLFGFTSAAGPQLYPNFQYVLPKGDLISAYIKYSPVSNQTKFLAWSTNHEFAGGISFGRKTPAGTFVKYSLDYTQFRLRIQGINIASNSVTLGISYDFWYPK